MCGHVRGRVMCQSGVVDLEGGVESPNKFTCLLCWVYGPALRIDTIYLILIGHTTAVMKPPMPVKIAIIAIRIINNTCTN